MQSPIYSDAALRALAIMLRAARESNRPAAVILDGSGQRIGTVKRGSLAGRLIECVTLEVQA
jgi:hypothetical protein